MMPECKQVILRIKANSRCRHKVNERDNKLLFGTALFFKNRIKIERKKTTYPHLVSVFFQKKKNK